MTNVTKLVSKVKNKHFLKPSEVALAIERPFFNSPLIFSWAIWELKVKSNIETIRAIIEAGAYSNPKKVASINVKADEKIIANDPAKPLSP